MLNRYCMLIALAVCIVGLSSVASAETFRKFDAALNTIISGVQNNMPLPPDIQNTTDGKHFPILLKMKVGYMRKPLIEDYKSHGIQINEAYFNRTDPMNLYPAVATIPGLKYLDTRDEVENVYSGQTIQSEIPLDQSAQEILADQVWYYYDQASLYVRGDGILVAVADTGVDIYHPSLFRDDPVYHTYNWYDDGNGHIDNNGSDWVDLNRDSIHQASETLRFFDGRTTDWQGTVTNTDGVFQVDVDWLYNDSDNNSTRDYGSPGFSETSPGLGEMMFIAIDSNSNNALDPGESIVGLDESKVLATYNTGNNTRTRGVDLMLSDVDSMGHGTEVCGVMAGGWPGISKYTGIAPDIDLLMYNRWNLGIGQFYWWATQHMGAHIMLWEIGAWSGLYLDGTDQMDIEVNAAHALGVAQVVVTGNLAGNSRHASGIVGPGTPSEYAFPYIPNTSSFYHVWVTLLWAQFSGTAPTFDIYDPTNAGWYMNMPGDSSWNPIGASANHQFMAIRNTNANGTCMFHIEIQSYPSGSPISLSNQFFQININSAGANPPFTIHQYVADGTTGWGGGVTLGSYGNINVTDTSTITSPATADDAIAVASYSTRTDGYGSGTTIGAISPFSGQGPRITGHNMTDVTAPGDWDVYSHASVAESATNFIGEYIEFGGTSAAAPHVAGAAALYMQFDPATYYGNPGNLTSRIQNDAISDGFTGAVPNNIWGYGKLRVAITPIYSPAWTNTPSITPTPTATSTSQITNTPNPSMTPTPTAVTSTNTPHPSSTPTSDWTSTATPDRTSTPTPDRTSTPTPTITKTPTSASTFTPTAQPSSTPPPPTHTPEPPPTPSPTSTSSCTELGCSVYMPKNLFVPGDECYCDVTICNPTGSTMEDVPVFVVLDVYTNYYFAPSFSDYDFYTEQIQPGLNEINVIQHFDWPSGVGSASGIYWYAAMTDPDITETLGEIGIFEFGWSENI